MEYMMKQRIILIAALSMVASFNMFADVTFSIRYFDKQIYYTAGSPIYVQVTINNDSPAPFRFKLADERAFSLDFEVRTQSNVALASAETLMRKRNQNQQVFFREISLESGESFSFVEDIRDYVTLSQSGSFVVWASLYPELYRTTNARALESNRLSLSIRPGILPDVNGVPQELDSATNALLVREKLPPDQVVEYFLTARQRSQWEKFFLYLDLEAMIARDSMRQREWRAESEEGRQRLLARYRADLQSAVIDGDISMIPTEFQIERTSYTADEGTVIVQEKFRIGNSFTERKRYTYYLQRKDDIWTIVDYTVLNLGTE
ncbi:MAG: hypothetical protein LBD79_02780 [Treponema sp.]|jgi:hypothetical protein|nr:hypothetical protein [Treponema sp.]